MCRLSGMLRILVLFALVASFGFSNPNHMRSDLLSEVNALRTRGCVCGTEVMLPVRPVRWHDKLELSATLHAKQMQRHRFFEHYSLGGKNIGQRVSSVGYPWQTVGENLARGQHTVHEVVQDWKKSPTHCRVMMHAGFEEVGFARSGNYWVMHLGKRKAVAGHGHSSAGE